MTTLMRKSLCIDFGDFSTNNNVGNEDEWGKFEDDKMGSAGSTFTEPINDVGRFSDKQRSILDAQTAKLRSFGKLSGAWLEAWDAPALPNQRNPKQNR